MSVKAAVKLYESFRERKPRRIGHASFKVPAAVACMGYVEGIDYRTTHGKKVTLYHHDFAPGSRPLLAVSSDGKQLLLLGGRYQFTARGIVDKDAKGREVENAGHGKTINPRRKKPRKRNPGVSAKNCIVERHGKFYLAGQGFKTVSNARATRYTEADALKLAKAEHADKVWCVGT